MNVSKVSSIVGMYVARVPNRGSPPAVLLRESYREAGKVKNRTLANLSRWPGWQVDALAQVLKGVAPAASAAEGFEITRSAALAAGATPFSTCARASTCHPGT